MINDMAAQPYLRYAPDGHLVYASFASAFLLKLLRHKFVHLLPEESRSRIIPLVERLIRALSDSSVAIDDSHTPKIYARFLAGLLHKHRALASAQGTKHEHDKDAEMSSNIQDPRGLSIDLSAVHQRNDLGPGPLSPPSPHPSIRVTPPATGDQMFGYMLHDPNEVHAGLYSHGHGDMDMLGHGSDMRLDVSTVASGSGTVHPTDEMVRDEDDEDISQPLRAVNAFWQQAAIWQDVNMTVGNWEKDFLDQQFVSNLDG
jgi:hypothetical protein